MKCKALHISLALLPAFLICFGCSELAWADVLGYTLRVECISHDNVVTIEPFASYDSKREADNPYDCVFENGRHVRAKMGISIMLPYGTYSGPDGWVSLWIDYVKVQSRIHFSCPDFDTCDLAIKVSSKGMKLCRRDFRPVNDPPFTAPGRERCSFTLNKKLSKVRDHLEFPSLTHRKPPAVGSVVNLYEGVRDFCSLFRLQKQPTPVGGDFYSNALPPDGYEPISDDNPMKFDANNDNKEDNVVGLHWRSHATDSDTFYVYDSTPVPDEARGPDAKALVSFLQQSATHIIPDTWGKWPDHVSAPWWDPADEPNFQLPYLYVRPFRWQGVTYFMTGSAEVDKAHWYLVLRPERNFSVTTMCAFHVVRERY